MYKLAKAILQDDAAARFVAAADNGRCPALITGVGPSSRAHLAAAARISLGRPVVVVCSDEQEAARFMADMASFTGEEPGDVLTGRDLVFYNVEGVSRQAEHARLRTLYAMRSGSAPVTAVTIEGLLMRTIPPETLEKSALLLHLGDTRDPADVTEHLVRAGYSRCSQVEGPGQFAMRGGILDFYSAAYDSPVRCEFFGDEIDSMSFFDTQTQRRTDAVDTALILPACETVPDLYSGPSGEGRNGLAAAISESGMRLMKKKNVSRTLIANMSSDSERLLDGRTFPAADRYQSLIYPERSTAADYFPPDALVFISEPHRVSDRAKAILKQMADDCTVQIENGLLAPEFSTFSDTYAEACARLEEFPVLMADNFLAGSYDIEPRVLCSMTAKQLPSYGGSLETAAGDIAHYAGTGYSAVVLCADRRRADILCGYLTEKGISVSTDMELAELPQQGTCAVTSGALSAGMEYPTLRLAVITEGQILGNAKNRRKTPKKNVSGRQRLASYADLSPGDLVVHEYHGIGRFVGIFKLPVDGVEKDYVKIAYAGTDSLYVPATNLDLVQKYIGGGEDAPVRLSKMGGADWEKTKSRAKGAARQMARELIALYAARQKIPGHAFAPDSVWQTEFEAGFGYEETDDQLRCIDEIKADMEKPLPMDRILCGDVGFGKTEVALRAVMKCVLGGRQAAILVPTTVLAQQHYTTVVNRFANYPVHVEVLSRFRTAAQIKKAVASIASGQTDIVIGTHRLLQKDIRFKSLGLLIVDEEQRFGVSHKERLKEMSKNVDVLTLTATPIPRTLNMALSGLRDMSTIEEPPSGRQPVQTYVIEHDWKILEEAMRREISRGGQVYYLHNRIETIARTAARISAMLPDATVDVAHGKMDEESLSRIMERLASGEVQVLVCTTIIETGIDIPNVNTLIIEDADRFGLSQLHQLRGRVGRSPRRAFAYLTFRKGRALSEIAEKRLSAIREFAEFNSGFKIAMRDLEIRGAGNLLGAEQSGHMMSVGYDMYLKLLEEAVLEEKGEKPPVRTECSADLTVSANIPESYVPSGEERIDLYRRIALIKTEDDADDMISELIDRYGDPPHSAVALVSIALMRGEAERAGITEISQKSGWLRFRLSSFDMEQVSALYSLPEFKGRIRIDAGAVPAVLLKLKGSRPVDEARRFVAAYAESAGNHENGG